MSDGALTGWLSKRRESAVAERIREHTSKVLDVVTELDRALKACVQNDRVAVMEALRRVDMEEKAADNLEVDILRTIVRGELEVGERQGLTILARRVDDISDHAKQASLNLQLLMEWERRVPGEFWTSFKEMGGELVKACKALGTALQAYGQDEKKVLKWREEVKRLEHRIDGHYFDLKRKLIRSSPDPRAMTLLVDTLTEIEAAADMAKEAADQLLILIMAGR